MIEQFIYGKYLADENGHPQFVSYFNIIDTRLSFTKKLFDVQETTRVKKNSVPSTQTITDSTKPAIQQTSFYANNFLYNSVIIESLGGNVGLGFLKSYNQYPEYKNTFIAFINLINKAGYWVHITDGGDRSLDDQIKFYRLNRKNAVPGTSKHGKGSAMDINLIDKRTGERYLKHTSTEKWLATGVIDIAKSVGLKWGGEFPGYKDNVHFEIANKREQLTNAQREADEYEYETKIVKKMQVDREGIFKNFKTNSYVFHFFRKKLQLAPEHRNVTSREIYNNSGLLLDEVTVRSKGKNR